MTARPSHQTDDERTDGDRPADDRPDDERTDGATDGPTDDGRDLRIDAPERSPVDEPITTGIHVRPNETVTLEATATDGGGGEWRSRATFEADADGVVDLAERAPESGSYDGVHPMGWCWSMTAQDDDHLLFALMDGADLTVDLRATAGDRRAERTVVRTVAGGATRREVATDAAVGTLFEPAGEGPHPGVLVLHGSGGHRCTFTAALLARHGFAALALQYFGDEDGISDSIERVPLDCFDGAAAWLRDRPSVRDAPLGLVGRSWGALAALLVGSRSDWVGAVVSYAGSGVVWDTPTGEPAWVDADGDPVPCVSGQGKPTLREGQLDEADAERRRAATVPVERIDGPVLLLSGAADSVWPARRLSTIAADRLRRHEFGHEFAHLSYDDAGHFVTPPYLPKAASVFRGTLAGRAHADADAWPTVLEYLRRGLDGAAAAE